MDYAQRSDQPLAMRTEALDALGTWTQPSELDRVTGRYRKKIKRAPEPIVKQTAPLLTTLTKSKEPTMRLSAVGALGQLKATEAAPALLTRLRLDPDPAVRVAALTALAQLGGRHAGQGVEQALADPEKQVRVVALDKLAETQLPPEQMADLLHDVIRNRTTEEQQAALLTLATLPLENTKPILEDLLQQLADGELPVSIQLELADAVDSTHSAEMKSRLAQIRANQPDDALAGSYQACLEGGDPERGRMIAFESSTAQCMQCHAYDDYGGNAGPRLNGVGSRLTRQQLLEALINPSARLAHGYGTVTLEMRDGRTLSGILQDETDTELTLKIGNQPDQVFLKENVVKRTNAPSSMPSMKTFLTKKEIRDVVSMLATLTKEDV